MEEVKLKIPEIFFHIYAHWGQKKKICHEEKKHAKAFMLTYIVFHMQTEHFPFIFFFVFVLEKEKIKTKIRIQFS